MNTTVKVVLAMALYYCGYFNDWVMDTAGMIDVEAAFLSALLDTDAFIKMPEGLRELLLSQGVSLGDVIIKLLHAQYRLAGKKSKTLDGTVLQNPCVHRA